MSNRPKAATANRETFPAEVTSQRTTAILPAHMAVDPALSKDQQAHALAAMEQDARQLSTATAEGMGGGEPTRLHEVLVAKNTLDLPADSIVFAVVVDSLRAKLPEAKGTQAHAAIVRAIEAVEAACAAIGKIARARAIPSGEPATPALDKELAEELNKEKLDPDRSGGWREGDWLGRRLSSFRVSCRRRIRTINWLVGAVHRANLLLRQESYVIGKRPRHP